MYLVNFIINVLFYYIMTKIDINLNFLLFFGVYLINCVNMPFFSF